MKSALTHLIKIGSGHNVLVQNLQDTTFSFYFIDKILLKLSWNKKDPNSYLVFGVFFSAAISKINTKNGVIKVLLISWQL